MTFRSQSNTYSVDRRALLSGGLAAALLTACNTATGTRPAAAPTAVDGPPPTASPVPAAPAGLEQQLSRTTVPVLCWHQLRDWTAADGSYARTSLVCPPTRFRAQLDALATDGWTTISPDQYLAHVTTGAALPTKPVLLSFDDSQATQVTEGLPQLQARGMTATFFAMTVVLDKPGWLSRDDLRGLRDAGMTVAAHTSDHQRVDRYTAADWTTQLDEPRELLERATGAPVEHFAYPYGAWSETAFEHLHSAGYRTGFQLSDRPSHAGAPLLTLRRVLMSSWTGPELLATMARTA